MSALKPRALNFLLVCSSTIIAILLCEGILRIFAPEVTLYPRYIESADYSLMFPQNETLVHRQGGLWEFIYHTNELGFRGPFLPPERTQSTTNIIVTGDSFTFGQGVSDNDTYAQEISRQLGEQFFVVNAAIPGWGIDSEIKWFFSTGQHYSPKYFVLQFCTNDPSDSFTGVTKVKHNSFEFSPHSHEKPAWQKFVSSSYVLQNSHIYSALRRLRGKLGQTENQPISSSKDEQTTIAQNQYIEMLTLLASELKKRGTRFLFVSVTHQKDETYRYDLADHPLINKKVEQLATDNQLEFVTLPLRQMATLRKSPEGHQWGTEHHEIVGKMIAQKIRQLDLKSTASHDVPRPSSAKRVAHDYQNSSAKVSVLDDKKKSKNQNFGIIK